MLGVKEVKIVHGRFPDEVEDEINGLLKSGWELYGKLIVADGPEFVQMMVKLKDPERDRPCRSIT